MHPTRRCHTCSLRRAVNDRGVCRLCWRQAYHLRQPGQPIDLAVANRHGQQLFLAGMSNPRNGHRKRNQPAALAAGPADDGKVLHRLGKQLDLFAPDSVRDAARRYGFPDPPSATFAAILDDLARDHAASHGWGEDTTRKTRIGLRVLLGMTGTATGPIKYTDVARLTGLRQLSARPVLAILTAAGELHDDRPDTTEAWFTNQIRGLPTPMSAELRAWFTVMHHGSSTAPRSRPRSDITIHTRMLWAMPTLRAWAQAGHQSLREISREDVTTALPAGGNPRATLGRALRSIFGTLKARKLLFTNPTAGIKVGSFTRRIPLPADTATLQAALNSHDPTQAALGALTGYHGLRQTELSSLRLTDIRDGRIHLPDRVLLLAEPVKGRLATYLTYRNTRWPSTLNPHCFIHFLSAGGTHPVSSTWVSERLRISARAVRQDRIVNEAIATGGDTRRICDFFGVTIATANHYASSITHAALTDDPTTTPASGSRTEAPH